MEVNISKSQIQNLYAIASKMGIFENGNKDDDFHNLVENITGKRRVSSLTKSEYYNVRRKMLSLQEDLGEGEKEEKNKKLYKKRKVAAITDGQINKIWYLMYEFEKLSPSKTPVGKRLKGIIKKQLNIDVDVRNPFIWMTYKDGSKLIEILKNYVRNVKN